MEEGGWRDGAALRRCGGCTWAAAGVRGGSGFTQRTDTTFPFQFAYTRRRHTGVALAAARLRPFVMMTPVLKGEQR